MDLKHKKVKIEDAFDINLLIKKGHIVEYYSLLNEVWVKADPLYFVERGTDGYKFRIEDDGGKRVKKKVSKRIYSSGEPYQIKNTNCHGYFY